MPVATNLLQDDITLIMLDNARNNTVAKSARIPGEVTLELQTLENFLRTVERRAFLMARTALGSEEDAMDAVQDTMEKLVQRYGHRPEDEWRPLFYRILRSRINDTFRRRKVRDKFKGWLGGRFDPDDGAEKEDPFQQVAAPETSNPAVDLERRQRIEALQKAVADLPRRQQQAFMLRCWEGLSTLETAAVMKCSEGSVKTHYFRALQTLKVQLEVYR